MIFGIFNDEGCVEGDFASRGEAEAAAEARYSDDDVTVEECCHDHPEQPSTACEECNEDDGGAA